MRRVALPGGTFVPALGQGTWRMGEDASRRRAETEALRTGVELGMTMVDTAEMYGDGETERFLGDALRRAADLALTPEDLAELDAAFPPPARKTPLEML